MIAGFAALAVVMMLMSVPLFFVFGISSAAIAIAALKLPTTALMQLSFDAMTKQVLVAIPIFVFAGNVMLHGGAAKRLVDLALKIVGHLPGGLGVAMVVAMGTFGAICGSILAAIVAIGTMMMPTMVKSGYPRPFVVVLAAAAALIDALIPPSNTAIIFSSLTTVPVSRTFAAGVFPGFVLMGLLISYVMWRCRDLTRAERATWSERAVAFWYALPVLAMPVGILGGLYSGLLTPAESASFAAVYGILLGILERKLTWKGFVQSLKSTAETTTVIFVIIAMATFFSVVITYTRLPQELINAVVDHNIGPITFFALAGVVFLVLGTFIEVVPIFYLTLPIFVPLCDALKIDLLQFYVFMTGLVGVGMLTPPVCVGVYTASAVIGEPPNRAFRAVPPFIVIGIIYAAIMVAFPWLATWLPSRF